MSRNLHQSSSAAVAPLVVRVYDRIGHGFFAREPHQISVGLTFDSYTAHVLDVYGRTGMVRPVRVQVRKRGAVLCGRVLEASPGDWFKVDSYLGQTWFAGENVRLCGGNGCSCEGEATQVTGSPRACAGAPGACAVPLGKTGTTTVEGAR